MKRDFIYITDFNVDEIHNFFESAVDIKSKLINGEDFKPFQGKSLAMIFAKPSARTRVSFETGFFPLRRTRLILRS